MTGGSTIPRDRWEQVQELFHTALGYSASERQAFLDGACRKDAELRNEVESLLDAHDRGGPLGSKDVPPASSAPTVPSQIGPYRVFGLIGEGGMGSVYLAEREGEDFKQRVALKLMRHAFDDKELADRLRSERRILARLEHPGIARLIVAEPPTMASNTLHWSTSKERTCFDFATTVACRSRSGSVSSSACAMPCTTL